MKKWYPWTYSGISFHGRLVWFAYGRQSQSVNDRVYKTTEDSLLNWFLNPGFGSTSRYNSRLVYKWNLLTIQGGRRCCCILHLSHRVRPVTHGGGGVVRGGQREGSPVRCHGHLLLLTALQAGRFGVQVSLCGEGGRVCYYHLFLKCVFSPLFPAPLSPTEAKKPQSSAEEAGAAAALCWSCWSTACAGGATCHLHVMTPLRCLFI